MPKMSIELKQMIKIAPEKINPGPNHPEFRFPIKLKKARKDLELNS